MTASHMASLVEVSPETERVDKFLAARSSAELLAEERAKEDANSSTLWPSGAIQSNTLLSSASLALIIRPEVMVSRANFTEERRGRR